jgi:putative transposase
VRALEAGYPLSFRQIEEIMTERGVAVFVDHSTLHRWSMKMLPVLAAAFCRRKRAVGRSPQRHPSRLWRL